MSFKLTLTRLDGTTRTFGGSDASGADRLLDVDIARTHTGLSDFEATVPRDPSLEDAIFAGVEIARSGSVLFRGRLEEVRSQDVDSTTVLAGRGRGVELTDDEATVRFTNRLVHNAVADYIANQTDFAADVTTPTPNASVSDERAARVSTTSEFQEATDIAADTPLIIESGDLRPAQTAFVKEAESALSLSGTASDDAASADNYEVVLSGTNDSDSFGFSLDHEIPASDVEVQIRIRTDADNDGDGLFEFPGFRIEIDGETIANEPASNINQQQGFKTDSFSGLSTSLQPGTHTLTFSEEGTDNNGVLDLDVIVVGDARFTRGIPSLDGANRLSGPNEIPGVVPVILSEFQVPWNLTEIEVDANTEETNNTTRPLDSLQTRVVGGTFSGEQDTLNIVETPSTAGSTIEVRVVIGSTSRTRLAGTPTRDFEPNTLQSLDIRFSGNDLGVIEDRRFQGSDLQNLQRLVEAGAMRFAVPHDVAEADKRIEAFRPSDDVRTLPDVTVLDEERRLDVRDYANEVTVRGARRDDGTRPTATVADSDEIAEFGRRHLDVTDPSITTGEDAGSEARRLLGERLGERDQTGRLEIVPEVVLPGPSRTVTFRDGTTVDIPLEEVQFQEAAGEATGTLQFSFSARLAERIARLQRDTAVTRRSF